MSTSRSPRRRTRQSFEKRRRERDLIRFRHPQDTEMRSVEVDGQDWKDFDAGKEWVRIQNPRHNRYSVVVDYL